MERKNYMKCNAEMFKDLMCKVNRISPNADIKFASRVYHGTSEEGEFKKHEFKKISSILIEFEGTTYSDRDEIIITVE